tara:strand:+ start:136 stop:483 length:348 start_codon:yes stop_codon:yes gene_type:complete
MSYRTSTVGLDFTEIVSAFDVDGISRLTGQTSSDFDVSFYRNGAKVISADNISPTWTIAEIDTDTGEYALSLSGGFSVAGHWVISVVISATEDLWRTDVEVVSTSGSDTISGAPF